MKKIREFHDNEREISSGESELLCRCGTIYTVRSILMSLSPHRGCGAYSRARLLTFLSQMRRLFEGDAYWSKYGMLYVGSGENVLARTTRGEEWGSSNVKMSRMLVTTIPRS